jgi:tetratricopeptide (TPR) repeat protein
MTNDTAPLTWEEYNESGRRLFAGGDLAGAEEAFAAAIAEAEREGEDPLHLASSLSSLAQLKYQQKDALRAEELFRRALTLREQALGPDDKSVIISINNLAALYVSRGALDDAEPLLKRAMAASVKRVEQSQGDLAINLNNLARLYFKRGAYAQAEPLLLRLLTLKRPMGPEHPEVATVLVSLAKVRHALGKHDAAERVWRRVLTVRERTLAPTDPAVLQAIDGLADALAGQGKLGPACDLRERALAPRLESMGADHPLVAAMQTKLEETKAALAASTSSTTIRMKRPAALETTATSGLTPVTDRAPIELDTAPPVVVATPTVRRSMPVPAATDGESGFGGRIAAAAGHNGVNGRAPTPAPVQWIEPVSKPRVLSVDKVPVDAAAAATASTTVELPEADVGDDPEDDDADAPAPRKPSLNFGRMVGGGSHGSGRGLTIALGAIAAVGCIAVAGIVLGPSLLAKFRAAPPVAAVAVAAAPVHHTVRATPTPAATAPTPAPAAVESTAVTPPAPTPVAPPAATPAATPVAAPKPATPAPVATHAASGPPAPANGFAAHMGRLPAPDTQAAPAPTPPAAAAPAPTHAPHATGTAAPPDQDLLPPPPSVDIDSAKKP